MSKYQALEGALKAGPTAYARKWHVDGVEPKKELNQNGRWAWPAKFKILPITEIKFAQDDVALWAVDLPAIMADLERAEKALEKIAAIGGEWGPFPETKPEWAAMAIVTARETLDAMAQIAGG